MKKCIFIFLLFNITLSFGQRWKYYRHELFFGAGTTNYFGDIGGAPDASKLLGIKDFSITETRYNALVGWNYRYTRDISVRYNVFYAALTASDAGSKNASRGLSFSTNMVEVSAQFQYYFFNEYRRRHASAMFNRRGMVASNSSLGLYAFAGLGGIFFMPSLSGSSDYLNQNNTTRKTTGYTKINAVIPFGVGGSFALSKRWLIGFEIGQRFTMTDFIDSYWTKWSHSRDIYWFTVVYGVYKIRTDRYGRPILFGKHL